MYVQFADTEMSMTSVSRRQEVSRRAANHSNHHRRSSRARTLSQALHSNAQGSLQPSCRCLQTQNRALLRFGWSLEPGITQCFARHCAQLPIQKEKKIMTYIKPFITLFLGGARVSLKFNPLELNWILQCLCQLFKGKSAESASIP